ncbi:MAG TPA: type I-U CRISPR-associated protein Cas5/Cas6 [Gammaproteobacteria bacterium]|nr:type I-U CRISPR-associated protein Cas5/Cas6 [Gammaproteobacteria bacterium]
MEKLLLMQVQLLDDRYHGEGDWPPSPARLFQALIAGNAVGAHLPADCADALRWLESVPAPPEICAQRGWLAPPYTTFVPNNDLDTKGGDPRRIANIRVGKSIRPRHIDSGKPLVYSWRFEASGAAIASARRVCEMAGNLYQLGRGVDMAWANAELLDAEVYDAVINEGFGEIFRPGGGQGEIEMECPQRGSLSSLLLRFQAHRERLSSVKEGGKVKVYFANPPKARFQQVAYNPSQQWRLFDLRSDCKGSPFRSWPQEQAVSLVEQVRDKAAERLSHALPDQAEVIERVLIGRNATQIDKVRRVRLIPLSSIGHEKTDRSIRRLLVMVPPDCPLRFGDIEWAISGLALGGEGVRETVLVSAEDLSMLRHYAIESGDSHRLWRSVTPVVLSRGAARRRIAPRHRTEQAKPGGERSKEEQRASEAVIQALRHADIRPRVEAVRVQREPFSNRGLRAEAFAEGTRFDKERLWHVELHFAVPMEGPLVIGDGRYIGLGLLAPVRKTDGVLAYQIDSGLSGSVNAEQLAQAMRRAVMARVQHHIGGRRVLPSFFTGHARDGSPLRAGNHRHLVFVADLLGRRLLIIAPHVLEGRHPCTDERKNMELLDHAMRDMRVLQAGQAGSLNLSVMFIDFDDDCLFGRSLQWETVTEYKPTRYSKKLSPTEALVADVLGEVERRGLPKPQVEVLSAQEGPNGGLAGKIRLEFRGAQSGPIILGRTCHFGGGLFCRV